MFKETEKEKATVYSETESVCLLYKINHFIFYLKLKFSKSSW
ncbi:hypothetical protein FH5_05183 [Priestia endophytica]|nr:hypothetical protein FH5_05183 [Priestia endophytica]